MISDWNCDEFVKEILDWWNNVKYITVYNGGGPEPYLFPEPPLFVTRALVIQESWNKNV
jgi:hypothetical protein